MDLIRAWITITTDPAVGADQTLENFWERVLAHFQSQKIEGAYFGRTAGSLENPWGSLQKSIMNFAGVFNKIMNDLPSGHNEKNALEEALSRYMLETQKAFKYQEGYHLLKDCPKFMPLPKSTGAEIAEDGEQGIFKTPERPIGKDSARKRNRDQSVRSEDISEQRQRLLETAQQILAS